MNLFYTILIQLLLASSYLLISILSPNKPLQNLKLKIWDCIADVFWEDMEEYVQVIINQMDPAHQLCLI